MLICHFKELYPLVSKGITLAELPDRIAVYLELGNCLLECEGCHSNHLWYSKNPITEADKMTHLKDIIDYVWQQKKKGADAVVIMGGSHNKMCITNLIKLIKACYVFLPVGLYVGLEDNSELVKDVLKKIPELTWLKTGGYKKELGGLDSPKTNQKFYRRNEEEEWVDHSFLFCHEGGTKR